MSVKEQISSDLKKAMKAKDQIRVDTLRSALSAFTYKKVEKGVDLTVEEETAVIQKQVKQRNDSIAEYAKANRNDLMERELIERDILARYLPAQKSKEEITAIVRAIIAALPADARNQGAIMKVVMPQVKGLADGNLVRQVVTDELNQS